MKYILIIAIIFFTSCIKKIQSNQLEQWVIEDGFSSDCCMGQSTGTSTLYLWHLSGVSILADTIYTDTLVIKNDGIHAIPLRKSFIAKDGKITHQKRQ